MPGIRALAESWNRLPTKQKILIGAVVGGGACAAIGIGLLSPAGEAAKRDRVGDADPPVADALTLGAFLDARAYLRKHPRFGPALAHLESLPESTVKRGHLAAAAVHLDALMQAAARVEQGGDEDAPVLAIGQMSAARRRLMRRLVRIAKDSHVPVTSKHRLIDETTQAALDEIRTGCEELLHNANLDLQVSLYNRAMHRAY